MDDLDLVPALEDDAVMPKTPPKPKPTRRIGKPSGSAGGGRTEPKGKASPARHGRRQEAKKVPSRGPAPQPAANVKHQVVPSASAAPDLTPEAAQQQRAGQLLERLAKLAFEYEQLAFDDMELHRKAAHPNFLYTATILQAVVHTHDVGNGGWLEGQARSAEHYWDEHRNDPRPPAAKSRLVLSVFERPKAASHMKRFVMQRLEKSSEDGRVPLHASSRVAGAIAEVMVGNLVGGGAVELAWEFLPKLGQDLVDDAPTREYVAHEVRRIIENAEPFKLEGTAEEIVRRVLHLLGYRSTKGLFDFDRKARARDAQEAGPRQRRGARGTKAADRSREETRAQAEPSDSIPPPKRSA